MRKTAIFLGAGASAAEGAPVQNNLFKEYFKSVKSEPIVKATGNDPLQMKSQLALFFKEIFDIDITTADLDKVRFPTFEEVLGLLDLAELRREAFKKYELEDFGRYGNRIRLVRQFIVLAMAKAIADSLATSKDLHEELIKNLKKARLLSETVFISTNYDILIDNAITALSKARPGANLDYGIEFTNYETGGWSKPNAHAVPLYKVHGSLNWFYCPSCNTMTLTPNVKGVIDLITDVPRTRDRAVCGTCRSIMTPIIVPPTFYKDMSRVFLGIIWNKAETALKHVERIIFCGYSFPESDMHIKYLLKRIQFNRSVPKTLRFIVINHRPGKDSHQAADEKERFDRFLSGKSVDYTECSFEDFTKAPKKFYR
jgi:NAD-dependent SIR2 family protein deacetylase